MTMEHRVLTCHLLNELQQDLLARIKREELNGSKELQRIIHEAIALYSTELCPEKPELDKLRRRQLALQLDIHRKDQFLAHLLKESADAILTIDNQRRVAIWNRGAEAIFGFSEAEIVGKPVATLVPLSRRDELQVIEDQTRRLGAVNNKVTQWVTRYGKTIQVMLTNTAIKGANGEYTGSSFVIKDVTRQRELEEAVRLAEHFSAIGRLAAGLAHEIKNPLAGIQGAIEVIQDHAREPFEQNILSDVLREVGRIDKIVRNLLDYAKPKTPELRQLQIETLVQRVVSLLKGSARGKVTFSLNGKKVDRQAAVLADSSYLEQVFVNLFLNGIEAMEGKGKITVAFKADAETVTVSVADTGPGVPIGLNDKVFDPFFTTKKYGTGLGLATCRRIVHEHGGTLWLDGDAATGAVFVLKLPKIKEQQ